MENPVDAVGAALGGLGRQLSEELADWAKLTDPKPEPDTQCRCPILIDEARCRFDSDQEDLLCPRCREIHKPMFDADWHTGLAGP
jgi:hypothetical protein